MENADNKEYKKVVCQECKKEFYKITNTHLWKEHQMSVDDYTRKYPRAEIEDEELAKERVNHLRGKTYEEIYGENKAKDFKELKSEITKNQMKDPEQIKVRKDNCGYIPTDEQKQSNSEIHTIHGKHNYRQRAFAFYGEECMRCGSNNKLVVHHKDFLNVGSVHGNHELDNLEIYCKSCHSKLHNEIQKGKFTGLNLVEKGAIYMLKGLQEYYGLDISNENFKDTPKRIARLYAEIFEGINCEKQLCNITEVSFPSKYDGMVIGKNIRVFSMCPHHFLPVEYIVNVGYIPDKKTIGISKLSRVVDLLAKTPELQEMFTLKIEDTLSKQLQPKGVIVQVKGRHFCMVMRGIKQIDSWTMTSSVTGVFKEDKGTREEFQLLLGR